MSDTIFATATARGKAGVAIIRISGPEALFAANSFGIFSLEPRKASLRNIISKQEVIDKSLVIYFPKGQSFTGEDIVEFQLHGSTAIINKVLESLTKMKGLRPAEAGEFTRRALINGVMDLTQIEGLADLIDSETESQRKQAQRIFSGALSNKIDGWRKKVIHGAALIEASIDFADEEIPHDTLTEINKTTDELINSFQHELSLSIGAERIREGYEVVLLGAPNSGKSSLINMLAGRDIAITSNVAGTTRDIIELRLDIQGLPVTLLDTAGIRDPVNEIESIGIKKGKDRAALADLRILLLDPEGERPEVDLKEGDITIYGKADIFPEKGQISSITGYGVQDLIFEIENKLSKKTAGSGLLVRERHKRSIFLAIDALRNAQHHLSHGFESLELAAAEYRSVYQLLEHLLGRVGVEDLLDEIFSSFCIGK